MRIKIIVSFFLLATLLFSCQPKFDGTSENAFKSSREKVDEHLTADEKVTLEKALRVITLYAMHQKWNDTTLNNSSFDEISLREIDGKTYKDVIKIAETFLKDDNAKKIEQLQKEIKEMEAIKAEYLKLKSQLDVLEAKPVKIDLVNGLLVITCAFTNHSKERIVNYSTVIGYSSNKNEGDGWYCDRNVSGSNGFEPNETKMLSCEYSLESAKRTSDVILWDSVKFPVTDFSRYNIVVHCMTKRIILNGTQYELGTNEFGQDAERSLQNKKDELKTVQEQKGTLDELVLTNQ